MTNLALQILAVVFPLATIGIVIFLGQTALNDKESKKG